MSFPVCSMECPNGACQILIEVTKDQTDESQTLCIGALARYMEQITRKHLNQYGLTREGFRARGKIWVIAWTSIEIQRLPKLGEMLLLRIWPSKKRGGMYARKYVFYTVQGEPLAWASSLFTLMDQKTRTLADPDSKLETIPLVSFAQEQPLPKLLQPFPKAWEHCRERIVLPEEIDQNGHLNNTHYIDWAGELRKEAGVECSYPRTVWVQYSRELLEGQTVSLRYQYEDHTLYVRGYHEEEEAFSVMMQG